MSWRSSASVRGLIYPFIAQGTRDEKIGLARILAITGDRESIAQVEWISKDSDGEVASEGLRALKALRARAELIHQKGRLRQAVQSRVCVT